MLHTCATLDLSVTSQSRDPVARLLWLHTCWVFFTLPHTQPLHKTHLNTGYLIVKIQANLALNKANTWLNKFNITSINKQLLLWVMYFMDYSSKWAERHASLMVFAHKICLQYRNPSTSRLIDVYTFIRSCKYSCLPPLILLNLDILLTSRCDPWDSG